MENNWFKIANSLEEDDEIFLKSARDLEEGKTTDSENSYFEIGGSLEEPIKNNSFKFEGMKDELKTPEQIIQWLKTIVSGEKIKTYGFGEGPQVMSSGKILVGLDELKEMVKNGDNIISAQYFENINMVDIEFQSFRMPQKKR